MVDFGKGCRAVGWHHPHRPLFSQLAQVGAGFATLRGLDPETAAAIDKANEMITARFNDVASVWEKVLDSDGSGAVSKAEFLGHRKLLGLTAAQAKLLFLVLDTSGSGWLTEAELGFLETFESRLSALAATQLDGAEPGSPSRSAAHLASPHLSTRSFQARAFAGTHQLKHAWLRQRAQQEIEKRIF